MIFSELYSAYYKTVSEILRKAVKQELTDSELQAIVRKNAFSESELTIIPALKNQKWQLLKSDLTTQIENPPSAPITVLEKQWLKAILLDPKIRLFDIHIKGLDDVEPLFTPDDFYIYDKYADGDDFTDEAYIERFRMILSAIHDKTALTVETVNRKGNPMLMHLLPEKLEYSEKDGKFRLISSGCRYGGTINLARITKCKPYTGNSFVPRRAPEIKMRTVTLHITDKRNALERVMLHFAHFEKQAERLGDDLYRLTVKYDVNDETELVIRILSFGPMVKAVAPESFVGLIRARLLRQMNLGIK